MVNFTVFPLQQRNYSLVYWQNSAQTHQGFFHGDGGADSGGKDEKVSRAIAGMVGGAGEFSYTRNSRMQAQSISILRPVLEREIGELNFQDASAVCMADFGCSVGANTIQYAEICCEGARLPVQYFFCDLPTNDFNTLFRQLEEWRDSGKGKDLFAAAVPGSFYGRLFPPRSLHVAISTIAVQWMSQVPDAVLDRASPAYNKGRVWIDRPSNPAVLGAYAQAAWQDLRNFLLARAEELVPGGLVILYIPGRADKRDPQWADEYAGPYSKVFESAWEDLVAEGIIDEERRDSFNIPVYCRSMDEVRSIAEFTNVYHIKRLRMFRQSFVLPDEVDQLLAAPEEYGLFIRNFTRALLNTYIMQHIGERSTAMFFDRLERNAAAAARERRISSLTMDCVLAILVRK